MATTVDQAFRELKGRLGITGLQTETISVRQTRIREVIATAMTVEDSFLTGSYSRSTMIGPLKEADIDIFMVLNPKYYHHYNGKNGGPAELFSIVAQ
jgi:hypothetical protein